ncbi:MAG: hypothetical protein NHF97_00045 [Flavobacteriia bacterium]|nr:hypothetical protein [Candidatus Bostrichicola ureolyticus]
MAGRQRSKRNIVIDDILEKETIQFFDSKVPPPSDAIWQNLIRSHNLDIGPKNLYTRALRIVLAKTSNTVFTNEFAESDELENCVSSDSDDKTYIDSENEYDSGTLYFNIYLTDNDWQSIQRSDVTNASKYTKLNNWTNMFAKKIYDTSKIQCALKFKNNLIARTKDCKYFLKIYAKCVECNANLLCFVRNKEDLFPEKNGLEINCVLKDYSPEITHYKKRHVTGQLRKHLANEMINRGIPASKKRKELAGTNSELFLKEPPNLPKANILRQIKYETNSGNRPNTVPLLSLQQLVLKDPFDKIVHEIGCYKFFIHYWLPQQIRIYNELCKREKHVKVVCDATGGVVKKIQRGEHLSGYILLYCLVVKIPGEKEGQISVAQMLSERHHANAIQFWLSEWIRLGAKPPDEFCCDYSFALLHAAVKAFSGLLDVYIYIDSCYQALISNTALPKCFIRIDVAHFIQSVCRWKELHPSKVKRKVRQFYIRGVGQLLLCTSLSEAKSILKALIITASSETEGFSNLIPTLCEREKKQLLQKFSRGIEHDPLNKIININADKDVEDVDDDGEDALRTEGSFARFVDSIFEEAAESLSINEIGDRDNLMHLPSILNPLKRIGKQ